jgi:hypothetical protein
VLPDGTFDAFVLDAHDDGETRHLELTIVTGAHKGDVVAVAAPVSSPDAIDLIGLPATLVVTDGAPRVTVP